MDALRARRRSNARYHDLTEAGLIEAIYPAEGHTRSVASGAILSRTPQAGVSTVEVPGRTRGAGVDQNRSVPAPPPGPKWGIRDENRQTVP